MLKNKMVLSSIIATSILLSNSPTRVMAQNTEELPDTSSDVSSENTIENNELLVNKITQTDTSISIEWTSVSKAI